MTGHLRARHRAVRHSRQDGLSLVEVMVALLMLSIVSISAAVVFIGSLRTTTEQSAKQRAISVATRALENVQSVPVSQVLLGRQQSAVQALNASAPVAPLVAQDITSENNFDASAGAGATPVIPLTGTELLDGTTYQVRTAINRCYLSVTAETCGPTAGSDGVQTMRATVNVTWGDEQCRGCTYAVSALLDRQLDPEFRLAQSRPDIQSVTPSSVFTNSSQMITIVGSAFESGVRVELASGGGTLSDLTRSSDGTELTVTWDAGNAPGSYVLTAINPDEGRITFSVTVTSPPAAARPVLKGECVNIDKEDTVLIDVQENDIPRSGGVLAIAEQPEHGPASVVVVEGQNFIKYEAPDKKKKDSLVYRLTTAGGSDTAELEIKIDKKDCKK